MKFKYLSFVALFLIIFDNNLYNQSENIIIDSKMTFEEATKDSQAPKEVLNRLCVLDVEYYSTDNKLHRGQLVIDTAVKKDVSEMFQLIKNIKFTVAKVIPIVKYNWSDDESMSDNNTSSFNYRFVAGTTRLSNHSFGRAIDINPFFNPVIHNDGSIVPKGAKYNISKEGTFSINHQLVQEFIKRGWRWGGTFTSYKDNHHFDKEK